MPYRFRKNLDINDDDVRDLIFHGYVVPFYIDKEKDTITILLIYKENLPSIKALENLREILASTTKSLDIVKYCLPECYKTELTWSINARSLQNFISLRSSKSALWEIRNLANAIYDTLPNEHKFIFEKCLPNEEG